MKQSQLTLNPDLYSHLAKAEGTEKQGANIVRQNELIQPVIPELWLFPIYKKLSFLVNNGEITICTAVLICQRCLPIYHQRTLKLYASC